jgi:hypothetical protein
MQPTSGPVPGPAPSPIAESARGWHNMQLAVMGFIGFCGVLRMGETPAGPAWLGWWSGGLSILALITSILSTWMVGSVAFPTYAPEAGTPPEAPGRLRAGIKLTFAAMAMMALAAAAGWWPTDSEDKLKVSDREGTSACGTLVEGAPLGQIWLKVPDSDVEAINISAIAKMTPVSSCA